MFRFENSFFCFLERFFAELLVAFDLPVLDFAGDEALVFLGDIKIYKYAQKRKIIPVFTIIIVANKSRIFLHTIKKQDDKSSCFLLKIRY